MTWFNMKPSFTTEAIAWLGTTITLPRNFNAFNLPFRLLALSSRTVTDLILRNHLFE